MNREIKFRAWDDEIHVMSYSNMEQFDDMLGFRFHHFDTEKPIYMQYTGLKDKNGKGIYEGDIVKREYVSLHPNKISDFKGVTTYYEGTYFIENTIDKNECAFLFDEIATNEVIGNIYENSDLLEAKNNE